MTRALRATLLLALLPASAMALDFERRVELELRLERVLESHRRAAGTPPSMTAPTREALARKVERDLRRSAILEARWRDPITARELRAEVARIRRTSRDPALLAELEAALENDPVLLAECLARRTLAARRFAGWIARDARLDGAARDRPDQWLEEQSLFAGWREPVPIDAAATGRARTTEELSALEQGPPDGRIEHTAVWTGGELIVWGGKGRVHFAQGGRYDPVSDSWLPTSIGPATPSPRAGHSAVWDGHEMIVWGGEDDVRSYNDGGRYDPLTDAWRPVATYAPVARAGHVAVWTGDRMVIWGGYEAGSTGGRYDPATDSWRATDEVGAPAARDEATAVWSGSEVIVWGGVTQFGPRDDGGRYDPVADSWRPTTTVDVPRGRHRHVAVWSGSEMIVWGGDPDGYPGEYLGDGAAYDPLADAWRPLASWGDVPSARKSHSAVWTGNAMIVWGGEDDNGELLTGASYDPALDAWSGTTVSDAPVARFDHRAVWTGRHMIVHGGTEYWEHTPTGGRYDPATDRWEPTSASSTAPERRMEHTAVWTGVEMIVWAGEGVFSYPDGGGRYVPALDAWLPVSTQDAPGRREGHSAIWTGDVMIVWGGYIGYDLWSGGRYDPSTDAWLPTSEQVPLRWLGRSWHSAIWTGSEMIVYGGAYNHGGMDDGAAYDPIADSWRPISSAGAPPGREGHAAVWTGSEMIVWGGRNHTYEWDGGGRYDPAADSWQPMAPTGTVAASRWFPGAVWTGSELIVWGGYSQQGDAREGARYDPVTDRWTAMPIGPDVEQGWGRPPTLAWDGQLVTVWGAFTGPGRYDPASDAWLPVSGDGAPTPRLLHTALWTGSTILVWGGFNGSFLGTGGIYDPRADAWLPAAVPAGDRILAAKGPGGSPFHDGAVRAYRADGSITRPLVDAFPGMTGAGARIGSCDVDADGIDELLAAGGPGIGMPPRVRGFDRDGLLVPGLDFQAFSTVSFGASVAGGRIDAADALLAAPGPSPVFGPHVRGFRHANGTVTAIAKVSFYAYGTLRYGANLASARLDADAFDEIVTGAGAGPVFGPHVRGFDYDGAAVAPIGGVSFFAYATPRYGVEVGGGDVDGDGYGEILTGPGPSSAFAAQLRGFDVDGGVATAIGRINADVIPGARFGLSAAGADLDADGDAEIACGAGPDPGSSSLLRAFDLDGSGLVGLPALSLDAYGISHGLRVASAQLVP